MTIIRTMLNWREVEEAAHILAGDLAERIPKEARRLAMLSIDHDAFSSPLRVNASPQMQDALRAVFVWQGDERLTCADNVAWWHEQDDLLRSLHGIGAQQLLTEHHLPAAADVYESIARDPRVTCAIQVESHAWGAVCARALQILQMRADPQCEQISIYNLDRHHDLGYINPGDQDTREQAQAHLEGGVSCDNWIWGAVQRAWSDHVVHLRPAGVWYDERRIFPPQAPADVQAHVEQRVISTASQVVGAEADAETALVVLMVRSGAWSPPWMDEAWKLGCETVAAAVPVYALDRDSRLPRVGGMYSDEIRPWSSD